MRRRLCVIVAAVFALGIAGCSGDGSTDKSSTGNTVAGANTPLSSDPKVALASVADKMATSTSRFEISVDGKKLMAGVMDIKSTQSESTFDLAGFGSMKVRIIGVDVYTQGGPGGAKDNKWTHTKTVSLEGSGFSRSFEDAVTYLKAVSDVKMTTKGHYEGTLDPAKVTPLLPADRRAAWEQTLKQPGNKEPRPFKATVDDKGRLLTFSMTSKLNGKPSTFDMKFTDHGLPVSVKKPDAGDIVEG